MTPPNKPTPEMVERATKLFPCNCRERSQRLKDNSHWHDCQSQYQGDVAAELERVRKETLYAVRREIVGGQSIRGTQEARENLTWSDAWNGVRHIDKEVRRGRS